MNRHILPALALGLFVTACRPVPEYRDLRITQTAPAANAQTGQRQEFGFIVKDSLERPAELVGEVVIDDGEPLPCTWKAERLHTIDGVFTEDIFRCPVDREALSNGKHEATFRVRPRPEFVDDDANDAYAEKSVFFDHDPLVGIFRTATAQREGMMARIRWALEPDDEEPIEIHGFHRGVRVFTSYALKGEATVHGILGSGDRLELRAYDRRGNLARREVQLP